MKTTKPRLPYIQDQTTYTLEEAAAKLRQRSPWPIRTLIKTGKLKHVPVGRDFIIPHSALVAFLEASRPSSYNPGDTAQSEHHVNPPQSHRSCPSFWDDFGTQYCAKVGCIGMSVFKNQ